MAFEVIYGFLSIFLIGCLSLIGIILISLKEKTLDRILFFLVAFATGTILATALFDLIPEALHHLEEYNELNPNSLIDEHEIFYFIMIGFVIFFVLERFIYWFHGHAHEENENFYCVDNMGEKLNPNNYGDGKIKNFAILNLIGDGLHNFLDGAVIMVAFLAGIPTGIVVSIAVLFHEGPQEVGDFGILIFGGFTKKKALIANFLSAMISMIGGLFGWLMANSLEYFTIYFLAFSGGGFVYLAATELMPEMMKEKDLKKSIVQAVMFLAGIGMIFLLINTLPHA
jgi:zinc and cadmium transporter